jgi:hypothetical protein
MPVKSRKAMFKALEQRMCSSMVPTTLSLCFLTFVAVLILPVAAMAYVGPGAGITLIGALWAVIVAIVLMVGGLLAWPLRAFFRRLKNTRTKEGREAEPGR